jgi:hypothetical protein
VCGDGEGKPFLCVLGSIPTTKEWFVPFSFGFLLVNLIMVFLMVVFFLLHIIVLIMVVALFSSF